MIMNDGGVYCDSCGWEGNVHDLDGIKCPDCGGAKCIQDKHIDYEYDNQLFGAGNNANSFNWNKP